MVCVCVCVGVCVCGYDGGVRVDALSFVPTRVLALHMCITFFVPKGFLVMHVVLLFGEMPCLFFPVTGFGRAYTHYLFVLKERGFW